MVEYGFYSSKNGDRLYDALQIGETLNGLIIDGIYKTVGDCFKISPSSDGTKILVGTGRAWFNNTWTLNRKAYYLGEIPKNMREFYVVIEINQTTRINSIKTTLSVINSDSIHQYPLAKITRGENPEVITEDDIENLVGTESCPYVLGILGTFSTKDILDAITPSPEEVLLQTIDDITDKCFLIFDSYLESLRRYEVEYPDPILDSDGNRILDSDGDDIFGILYLLVR